VGGNDEQPRENDLGACLVEPDGLNGFEIDSATALSAVAAIVESRRAPAELSTDLASSVAGLRRRERISVSARGRQSHLSRGRGSGPVDCNDPLMGDVGNAYEPPIAAPVVWSGLWRAELDCRSWRRFAAGRVSFPQSSTLELAETDEDEHLAEQREEEHKQPRPPDNQHADSDVLDTGASQPDRGNGVYDGLDNGRTAISNCGDGLATLIGYVPWLVALPFCGAAGASLSRRADGERWVLLTAGLFPVIAMASLVGFLMLIGKFVFAKPEWFHLPMAASLASFFPVQLYCWESLWHQRRSRM
jgi:hypothetical protein